MNPSSHSANPSDSSGAHASFSKPAASSSTLPQHEQKRVRKMSASQPSSLSNEKSSLIGGSSGTNDSLKIGDNLKYNCVAIRQEIQRFESVHPSIYAIYDLLELNSDQVLSLRIREHLLSIEGKSEYRSSFFLQSFQFANRAVRFSNFTSVGSKI